MQDVSGESRHRLVLNPDGFAERERLFAYDIGNVLLMLNLELQKRFGLRAEEYQIFMLIVRCTVQRFAGSPGSDAPLLCRDPVPEDAAGSISRRRISETHDIPFEMVRRTGVDLLARGMIVERRRGCLSMPGGTLARLGENALPARMAHRFRSVSNAMTRLVGAHLAGPE